MCPGCDQAIVGKKATFAELSKALIVAENEYRESLAAHSEVVLWSAAEPGNPDGTEALSKADARLHAASSASAKAMHDYTVFKHGSRATWTILGYT
jgi:hypothetical protein